MQSAAAVVATRPGLPVRAILGLCATGISLFGLVFPGEMLLPVLVLTPLIPTGGCANFLAAPIVFVVFGLGFLMSLFLMALGIGSIVLALLRVRGGLTTAALVNATIATLLLMAPLGLGSSGPPDQGSLGLGALLATFAVFPLAGTILLLAPSLYRSSRTYVTALVVTGLLLLPGAAGLVVLGLDLGGAAILSGSSPTRHC